MADGKSEPIEEVRVGQQVLATAPGNSHTGARTVSRVIVGDGEKHLVEVTVDTDGVAGNATGILTATGGHPFWVDNQYRWLDAKDLKKGDRLRTPAGELRDVVNTRAWTESHKVYNLSVDDLHTYYVLAGDTPVLVHNTGLCPEKIDDAFCNPSGRSSQEQFEYRWDKHAKGRGFTREQYLQDAKDWAVQIAQPGGKRGLNASLENLADGVSRNKIRRPSDG